MTDESRHAPQSELAEMLRNLQEQILQLQEQVQTQPGQATTVPIIQMIPVKLLKLGPFTGKKGELVEAWIFQVEQYFRLCQMNDQNTRAAYAVSYLKDNTALWWKSITNGAKDPQLNRRCSNWR